VAEFETILDAGIDMSVPFGASRIVDKAPDVLILRV